MVGKRQRSNADRAYRPPAPRPIYKRQRWQDEQPESFNRQGPFPFFRLPPELRHLIYCYVVHEDSMIDRLAISRYTRGQVLQVQLPVLQAHALIKQEAFRAWLQVNTIDLNNLNTGAKICARYIEAHQLNFDVTRTIRNVHVMIGSRSHDRIPQLEYFKKDLKMCSEFPQLHRVTIEFAPTFGWWLNFDKKKTITEFLNPELLDVLTKMKSLSRVIIQLGRYWRLYGGGNYRHIDEAKEKEIDSVRELLQQSFQAAQSNAVVTFDIY